MRFKPTASILVTMVCAGTLAAQIARVEENDPQLTYSGNWSTTSDVAASGGTYISSNSAGATVALKFTGDTLTIYRTMNTDGGQVTVTIDGKNWGRIYFVFPEKRYQVPAVLDNLGAGPHTIVLTVSGDQPNIYAGTTTYIDAFESPVAFVPNSTQTGWVTTYNQMRASIGLPPVRLSLPLTMAAQSHADYMTQNAWGAAEFLGRAGFTGFFGPDRRNYVGYSADTTAFELLSRNADAASALSDWNAGVYTRLYLVDYYSGEVGFGGSQLGGKSGSSMWISPRNGVAALQRRQIILCPTDKQTNVPLVAVDEATDPLPGVQRPLGFPISLHINLPTPRSPGNDSVDTVASLKDDKGADVPIRFIWTNTDQKSQIRDRNHYYIVPLQALAPGITYTARIAGLDGSNNNFDVTWSFTTGGGIMPPPPPPGSAAFIGTDTNTSGNWQGVYGTEGFTIIGESVNTPAYVTVTPSGMFNFEWANSTADPRAPQKGVTPGDRISACWYTSTSMNIELRFNDANPHPVAIYMLDWDGFGGGRAQTVDILDATNRVLDTRSVTNFTNGQYLAWNLSGRVTVRITNNNPTGNAVVQGLFFK